MNAIPGELSLESRGLGPCAGHNFRARPKSPCEWESNVGADRLRTNPEGSGGADDSTRCVIERDHNPPSGAETQARLALADLRKPTVEQPRNDDAGGGPPAVLVVRRPVSLAKLPGANPLHTCSRLRVRHVRLTMSVR
jgi:hypothetical protein